MHIIDVLVLGTSIFVLVKAMLFFQTPIRMYYIYISL